MADETLPTEGTETTIPEGTENTEQEIQQSPAEVEARAAGWLPKEEFEAIPENAGKKWRSAELFLELSPLYEKLDNLHKQNRTLNQGLKAFADHNKKIEQAAYARALKELKAERKAALEEQDFVKAEEIRDQIDSLEVPKSIEIPEVPEVPAEFVEWRGRNRWYDSNEDARLFADNYGMGLARQGKQPQEVLTLVTAKVKQMFPDLFVNPKRNTAPAVESGSGKAKAGSGFQMTREEEAIMNRLIASGAPITRDEYIAQLKKSRGV